MQTVVLQSFRTREVPGWISRCLESVRDWTQRSGYDYKFVDDRIFDLCGPEYLARVGDNKRSITNLARLELARELLRGGYDRAIWFDADIFVFAPDELSIGVTARYAFSKEAWITVDADGGVHCTRSINNAAFVFIKDEPDLDFLISTIRHIVAARDITTNYQVGVFLLTGLEQSLNFGLLRMVGMLSPFVLRAIVEDNVALLQRQAIEFGDPIYAANLCFALADDNPEHLIMAAMDKLAATRGHVLNRFAPAGAGTMPRPWARSTEILPRADAAAELARELDALKSEVAAARAEAAPARAEAERLRAEAATASAQTEQLRAEAATASAQTERLRAENQSFRRSRLLRLGRIIRRSFGLPYQQ